mmetsp:Transcript_4747/g.8403  ORF Transcript_4747/g.8403 Transcript_4747/m.8403 type:complete len:88 (+) Transcript_4747:33-296(+)
MLDENLKCVLEKKYLDDTGVKLDRVSCLHAVSQVQHNIFNLDQSVLGKIHELRQDHVRSVQIMVDSLHVYRFCKAAQSQQPPDELFH